MRHETPVPDLAHGKSAPRPEIPGHLFVGAMQGVPSCARADEIYEVWPKFLVMILTQGAQHFIMDGEDFRIDAGDADNPRPLVFMLNITRFCTLRFVNDSTAELKKVMISAPRPWLERMMPEGERSTPALREFFAGHLNRFSFEPSRHLLQVAGQILEPPPAMQEEIRVINRRAHALDIMTEALGVLLSAKAERPSKPSHMSRQHSERVRDYLIAHSGRDLTIEEIAQAVGFSPSTLQRHFKDHFGMTVFDFVRIRRLELAREALENEGTSIARAAFMAGYNNTSSFTTAFRKAFGTTPRAFRR